jgi:DNA uptake protein ComE-like DNA-binding protein
MTRIGFRRRLSIAVAILLLTQAAIAQGAAKESGKAAKPTALLDLNSATEQKLQELPGIGEAYAKRIVSGRPYESVKDLAKIGIPAATITKIAPLVTAKPLDLNTATEDRLRELPGIGEAYAKRIIAGRPYKSLEDLSKADIPSATIKKLTPFVTVEQPVTKRTPPKKGMVWVNTDTKVYHKAKSPWYGATKEGKWMTEAEAKKEGNRPAE